MAKISELADGGNLLNDDELIVLRAGGNVRATVANLPEVDASGNMSFADNEKANFGTGSDLQIYHNGSDSYIRDVGTGNLNIDATNLNLRTGGGNEVYLSAVTNGAVTLNYDNAAKLATTSTGVDVTGTVTADDLTVDGAVVVNSDTTTAITATQNANTDSNGLMGIRINNSTGTTYAAFGNSGADSVAITAGDAGGTGNTSLSLRVASAGSESEILGIDSTGIDVTGTVTADGLTVDGSATISEGSSGSTASSDSDTLVVENNGNAGVSILTPNGSSSQLRLGDVADSSSAFVQYASTGNLMTVGTSRASGELRFTTGNVAERMRIDSSGNIGIGTTSPDSLLHVYGTGSGNGTFGPSFTLGKQNGPKLSVTQESTDNDVQGLAFFTKNSATLANPSVERMRIDSDGNVGIGTSSPAYALDVVGGTTVARFRNTSGVANLNITSSGSRASLVLADSAGTNGAINSTTGNGIAFGIGSNFGSNEAMRIDSDGNVGIGTSSPAKELHVSSSAPDIRLEDSDGVDQYAEFTSSNGNLFIGARNGASDGIILFRGLGDNVATEHMRITASGDVGIGTSSPSARLQVVDDAYTKLIISDGTPTTPDAPFSISSGSNSVVLENTNNGNLSGEAIALRNSDNSVAFRTGGVERMRVDSSGNVGIGTTAPDKALVVSGVGAEVVINDTDTTDTPTLRFRESGTTSGSISTDASALRFSTGSTEQMRIDSSGNVGIGTTAPVTDLDVQGSSIVQKSTSTDLTIKTARYMGYSYNNNPATMMYGYFSDTSNNILIGGSTSSGEAATSINFYTTTSVGTTGGGSERMRIDSNGNVGIGLTDPAFDLCVGGATGSKYIQVRSDAGNSTVGLLFADAASNNPGGVFYDQAGDAMYYRVNGAEAMRIDASGNLLVGKTTVNSATTIGLELQSDGQIFSIVDGRTAGTFIRKTSDGSIVDFRKDSTTVGSIGSLNGKSYIAGPDVGVRFGSSALVPTDSTGNNNDTGVDIGDEFVRFNDLYLSGNASASTAELRGTDNVPLALQNSTASGNCRISLQTADYGVLSLGQQSSGTFTVYDNVTAETTFSVGPNRVITAAGGIAGIQLGGATVSNQLDDYEEGTFTPELADASSGGNTATAATATGVYTKVGNLVTLNMRFTDVDTTGLTGANTLFVRGMPFTNASLAQNQCEGPVRMDLVDVPTGAYSATFASVANSTYGSIRISVDNSNDVQVKVQDINSGSSDILITITHFV